MSSIHDIRFFGFSVVDVLATLIVAAVASKYTGIDVWKIFLALILISIPIHVLFQVQTHLMDVLHLQIAPSPC